MDKIPKIYLVSCVKTKGLKPTRAEALYTSYWFMRARCLIVNTGQPWFILSAKYGLISPETIVSPYDKTLNKMNVSDRKAWAKNVIEKMDNLLPDADEVVIVAGVKYRENLMQYLEN